MTVRFAILTVSDRASRGEREDLSGPALAQLIRDQGWAVTRQDIVPDELDQVLQRLSEWADEDAADVIITSGGTGFAPRDVTPEATLAAIQREAPGITEAMRSAGGKNSPHSMLSRARAGIRGRSLIINLPGSPAGAVENLQVLLPALQHAVDLLRGDPGAERGHQKGIV